MESDHRDLAAGEDLVDVDDTNLTVHDVLKDARRKEDARFPRDAAFRTPNNAADRHYHVATPASQSPHPDFQPNHGLFPMSDVVGYGSTGIAVGGGRTDAANAMLPLSEADEHAFLAEGLYEGSIYMGNSPFGIGMSLESYMGPTGSDSFQFHGSDENW